MEGLEINQSPQLLKSTDAPVQPLPASKLGHFKNTLPFKDVLELWRNANVVCFDVDGTVCLGDGLNDLAEFCGEGKAVAEWTSRAMSGSVALEEALAARLSLFNPSFAQVQDFLEKRTLRLSPGIEELVKKLKANNTTVYLISGGFREMINGLWVVNLRELEPEIPALWRTYVSSQGIPTENIYANQFLFGTSGKFMGFDTNQPTSKSGGKATVIQQIRKAHGNEAIVMVGDGATDLEARTLKGADFFICYAGFQLREAVAAQADWLVFSFEDLTNSLE